MDLYRCDRYNFEINIGQRCNMRCKFCFEQNSGYANIGASKDSLSYFASYMRHVKERTGYKISATMYGGEPLLYVDTILHFAKEASSFLYQLNIITNGINTHTFEKEIDEIKSLIKNNNLRISVSYNFAIQDETRQEGSYHKIRDSIRWLSSKGYAVNSPCIFTPKTIHRIGDVFDDFVALRKECKTNSMKFNYYKDSTPWEEIDLVTTERELIRIHDSLSKDDELRGAFKYSIIGTKRGHRRHDCLFHNVLAALGPDGYIYPGYDNCYDNDFSRNLFTFGKVGDPFEVLDKRREYLLSILPVDPPAVCRTCPSQCRVIPWRTLVDDISQYNQLPHEERCRMMHLIGKYINIRGV